jgi:hypothetical protein
MQLDPNRFPSTASFLNSLADGAFLLRTDDMRTVLGLAFEHWARPFRSRATGRPDISLLLHIARTNSGWPPGQAGAWIQIASLYVGEKDRMDDRLGSPELRAVLLQAAARLLGLAPRSLLPDDALGAELIVSMEDAFSQRTPIKATHSDSASWLVIARAAIEAHR